MNQQQFDIIKPLLKTKAGILLACILGVVFYIQELFVRDNYTYQGVPKSQHWDSIALARVFRNQGFMLAYSELHKNPLWVTYHLEPITNKKYLKRPSHFRIDNRSIARVSHDDYTGSGYDRGHMAPNYAISNLYGKTGQRDSFLMSNITPQTPNLNQKLWQRLEEVEANYFATWFKSVWVITGPIFDKSPKTLKSGVKIPSAFYKVYAMPAQSKQDTPKMLAFIMPQKVKGNERLDKFVVSVDEVETKTGLDFFHKLDDKLENSLEAKIDTKSWRLSEVANIPGRYAKSKYQHKK